MNSSKLPLPTPMRFSERGRAFIMRHEGFRASIYKDQAGHASIGFGHKLKTGEKFAAGMSRAQAETLLLSDVAIAEKGIHRLVSVALNQSHYDALVSFVYNVGVHAFACSTLLKRLNEGDFQSAANELLRWNKIRQAGVLIESAGLTARRAAERIIFLEQEKTTALHEVW
jgi:lysozyme